MSVEGWQWQSTWPYLLKTQKQFKHFIWKHVWVVDWVVIEAVSRPWFSQGLLEWLMSCGPASPTMAVYLQTPRNPVVVQSEKLMSPLVLSIHWNPRGRLYCCWRILLPHPLYRWPPEIMALIKDGSSYLRRSRLKVVLPTSNHLVKKVSFTGVPSHFGCPHAFLQL